MPLFGKRKDKKKLIAEQAPPRDNVTRKSSKKESTAPKKKAVQAPTEADMSMLPRLVEDLATAVDTSGETPARALRMLFALSEHAESDNRTEMVRLAGGMLVPELLSFLQRCERGSSEQYLALLVLNNISIPSENKRLIALDCGGAHVFSRLLCVDPSCHLMAIILVNLTFADADLRKELVSTQSNIQLIESLCFALRVASFSKEEYDSREPLSVSVENGEYDPSHLLAAIMEEDLRVRPALSDLDYNSARNMHSGLINPDLQMFPETARWCLSALKNLSRPSKDATAARVLMKSGIMNLIMRFLTCVEPTNSENAYGIVQHSENNASYSSSSATPTTSDPLDFSNAPTYWRSNSIQDAALFVVMNLAATKVSRDYIRELDGVNQLSCITDYNKQARHEKRDAPTDEQTQLEFQRLKARMALAYLVGSEGHFGQPRRRASNVYSDSSLHDSVLIVTESEVLLLIELLANTLQQRAKDGPGGYSAATFNVKWVLYAIRCLITQSLNQVQFVNVAGVRLNVLLMKVLAQHTLQKSVVIDADAAEHASFTLYLLSNYGFTAPFLPGLYGIDDKIAGTGSLSAKVLTSYIHMKNITPAGRHAADQLMLRLRYLIFRGSLSDLTSGRIAVSQADYGFDAQLFQAAEAIVVEKRNHGARPNAEIFERPILRSRAPKRGTYSAPWDNGASVSAYPNALIAVQQLSFGSTKVRHMDAIDDILIANNIANSANGLKTESYNYWWSWQDTAGEIQTNINQQRSGDSYSIFNLPSFQDASNGGGPFDIFGCGSLCATDTTVDKSRETMAEI